MKPRPWNPTPLPTSPRIEEGVRVELDWKAYFYEFCRVHGPQEPVEHGGRLLFRDGWTYSATSYEGPEWEPPKSFEELDALVARYWIIRRGRVTVTRDILVAQLQRLEELKASKSLPLHQVVTVHDTDGNKVRQTIPLLLTGLQQRLRWVREDLVECDKRLEEIARETVARHERSSVCQLSVKCTQPEQTAATPKSH